ncbi:MAG: hypothetical protein AABY22_31440, partial [Nanoarchaeota archaeon]
MKENEWLHILAYKPSGTIIWYQGYVETYNTEITELIKQHVLYEQENQDYEIINGKMVSRNEPTKRSLSLRRHVASLENQLDTKYSQTQVEYIAINNVDRQACQRNYESKTKLGQGTFGTVFDACNRSTNDCQYVMKIQQILSHQQELEVLSEVHIHKYLDRMQEKFNMVMVPKLYDSWSCEIENKNESGKVIRYHYIILEKWQGTLSSLGINQMKQNISALSWVNPLYMNKKEIFTGKKTETYTSDVYLFTFDQLISVTNVVNMLTKFNIVHCDLHLQNFLYRTKVDGTYEFCINDFGMSVRSDFAHERDFKQHFMNPNRNSFNYNLPCDLRTNISKMWELKDQLNMFQFQSALTCGSKSHLPNFTILVGTSNPQILKELEIQPSHLLLDFVPEMKELQTLSEECSQRFTTY